MSTQQSDIHFPSQWFVGAVSRGDFLARVNFSEVMPCSTSSPLRLTNVKYLFRKQYKVTPYRGALRRACKLAGRFRGSCCLLTPLIRPCRLGGRQAQVEHSATRRETEFFCRLVEHPCPDKSGFRESGRSGLENLVSVALFLNMSV